MFNFCLRPDTGRSDKERAMIVARRKYLLNYLRLAVASWARPEAILAVRRDQWHSEAAVLDLNPARRLRTNKRQPMVPIAHQCAPHLDAMEDHWRSEEHTSELQSLMRISYAVFCLKTKITIISN